jgi:hypothetical protein
MSTAAVMLTWLLLAAGAAPPPDADPMNSRSFTIPIKIRPEDKPAIQELRLLVSLDEGKTYQQHQNVTPDTAEFGYTAARDGVFWFVVQAVDKQGQEYPQDPQAARPSKKVWVRTTRPELRIVAADRQGEDIQVRWDLKEDYPNLNTLQLQYHTPEMPQNDWRNVENLSPQSNALSFRPGSYGEVKLRMQVEDVAHNLGTASFTVPATAAPTNVAVAPPPVPHPSAPIAPPGSGAATGATADKAWFPGGTVQPVSRENPQRGLSDPPLPGAGGVPQTVVSDAGSAPPASASKHTNRTPGDVQPLPPPPAGQGAPPTPQPRDTLPALQFINTRQVTLEYEVAKFGPSGVSSVDVYITQDDGQSWQPFGTVQSMNVPSTPDAKGSPASIRRSLTLEVPGEGKYGFYLVVKSGVGRSKPPPQGGTRPQIRLEVDTTAPDADLYDVRPDPSGGNAVLLQWQASDKNLPPRPVTLEWADRKDGQWQMIARDLPANGHYTWQLATTVPGQVFLRLTVRDLANNVSVAESENPVIIDLNQPDVTNVQISRPQQ